MVIIYINCSNEARKNGGVFVFELTYYTHPYKLKTCLTLKTKKR
jgi:hypothetical protein